MNRLHAYKVMQDGVKVTHCYFTNNEYLYISEETGKITTEDDYDFNDIFWSKDMFKTGWSFYSK